MMGKKKIVFLKSVKPFWIFKVGEKDENVVLLLAQIQETLYYNSGDNPHGSP